MCPLCLIYLFLLGVIDGAGFANDGHFDLTGVMHGFFDVLGDITRQADGFEVIDIFGLDEDANLTPSLQCKALADTLE